MKGLSSLLRVTSYHNWGQHRSLDHPPDGSVVIHVPTPGDKRNIQCLIRGASSWDPAWWFPTYPILSKCSLSTAQMVTHTVGVPVGAEITKRQKTETLITRFDQMRNAACEMWSTSHPNRWWCTSRSISSQGRRSPPVRWRGRDPRWRARSSWKGRSNGRISSRLDTPASRRGGTPRDTVQSLFTWEERAHVCRHVCGTHSVNEAVLAVLLGVQHAVLDEDWNSSQDERHKKVHVDEVPGAVQLPVQKDTQENDGYYWWYWWTWKYITSLNQVSCLSGCKILWNKKNWL